MNYELWMMDDGQVDGLQSMVALLQNNGGYGSLDWISDLKSKVENCHNFKQRP